METLIGMGVDRIYTDYPEKLLNILKEPNIPTEPAVRALGWKLDENDGMIAYDSTTNYNDGLLNGSPQWIDGPISRALGFDDANDYVDCSGSNLPVDGNDSWTINLWVYLESEPNDHTFIGGFGNDDGLADGTGRYLQKCNGGICFWGSNRNLVTNVPFNVGNWQMITISYNHLTAKLRIYKNARQIACERLNLADATEYEIIGNFVGEIDEFTIWSGVLTNEQIEDLMQLAELEEDLDFDDDVNLADFAFFAEKWQQTNCGDCSGADLTGDGDVDFADLKKLVGNWLIGI